MRTGTVSYKLEDLKKGVIIPIGFVGENDFTRVIFDAEEIYKKYPSASVSMKVQPPKGVIYPAAVTRDGNTVIWQVKEADVANRGGGELQLTFIDGETKIKTYIAKTDVKRSLAGNGPAPDPVQDWVDNAEEVLDDLAAMDNIAKTAEAGDVGKALSPKTVENGVVTEWQFVEPGAGTEDYTDLENKPKIGGVELSGDKSLHDLGIAAESAIPDVSGKANLSVVAPAFDQATANDAGSLVTYTDGVVYVLPEGHTAGTTWANTQKTATNIAEQQRLLLNDIQGKPETVNTDAEDVSMDLIDSDGYVAVRLKGGHIKTKNFDSEDVVKASATVFTDAVGSAFDFIDSDGYVVMRLSGGHIETQKFNSREAINPIEYKFSGDDLLLAYGYNDTYDAVVVLNEGRSNDLFDFSDLKLKQNGVALKGLETADLISVWHSGTDMHGPFEFLAVNNPDGYHDDSTDPGWTGGIHTVTIDGNTIKTAKTKYLHFFADGKPVTDGYGRCTTFEIRWANEVQAYNCVKADGTGRTSLIEYHDMIFDGVKFSEQIRITPTEDIKMQLWYGLQGVGFGSVYTSIMFIDGTNRLVYSTTDGRTSGNNVTSGIKGISTDHEVEIMVDINTDLGKRAYYEGTEGAFSIASTGKAYFNIIRKFGSAQVLMEENTNYYLNGSYRFFPAVQ